MPDGNRLLVLDVGNTNIIVGVYVDDVLAASWRFAAERNRTADEYGLVAQQLIRAKFRGEFEGAIVSSVVPPLNATIAEMVKRYFGLDPVFIEAGVKTGLPIQTDNPLEVGADRIANAVAAFELHGGPTIVVDFGTATTFDVVSAKGEYRGGIIAPGLTISAEALFARAARLPRVDIRRPQHLVGTNTTASMQSGIYFGYLALVDGLLTRMKQEIRDVRRVVATGTIAELLARDSAHIDEIDAELTLKGLKIIWERNRAARRRRG